MKTNILIFICIYMLALSKEAYAYIDPGTGSLILQGLIGTLIAGFFVIKKYWEQLKLFFKGNRKKNEDNR